MGIWRMGEERGRKRRERGEREVREGERGRERRERKDKKGERYRQNGFHYYVLGVPTNTHMCKISQLGTQSCG